MNQKILYQPIKTWLESKDFKVTVSGDSSSISLSLPIWDLTPLSHKIPDLIGVNSENKVVIVEVEQDKKKFADVLGRCMIWKCTATFVYIAYPDKEIRKAPILERLGLGQLSISNEKEVKEIIPILPEKPMDLYKLLELHPLDSQKESHLAEQLRKIT